MGLEGIWRLWARAGVEADQSSPPLGSSRTHFLGDILIGSALENDLPDLSSPTPFLSRVKNSTKTIILMIVLVMVFVLVMVITLVSVLFSIRIMCVVCALSVKTMFYALTHPWDNCCC